MDMSPIITFWIFEDAITRENFQQHCQSKRGYHLFPLCSLTRQKWESKFTNGSTMNVTNMAGENCIRLPMYPMNKEEIDYVQDVIDTALKACGSKK